MRVGSWGLVCGPDGTAQGAVLTGLQTATPKEPHVSHVRDSESSVSYELLVCSDPMMLPVPIRRGADLVYEELNGLADLMPDRYAEVFRFRWGLDDHFPHLTSQTARKFEIPQPTAEEMLTRCLWNVARYSHAYELPVIRDLVGDDPRDQVGRAWEHAEQRWGNEESNFSETVLLLAAAGLDVPEARRRARQQMIGTRRGPATKSGALLTADQHAEVSRQAVDRIVGQVIWPSSTGQVRGLDAFGMRRPLPVWAPSKSGVFRSDKLDRLVQFDSELELLILRQLDTDPRVVDYKEQPFTVPYRFDGEEHDYTPDVIVQLADHRVFVIEAKPSELLGDFVNWMKWASLAKWCEQHGMGFWVGCPQRSLVEHVDIEPDAEKRELVVAEVNAGSVIEGDYDALQRLIGREHLGLIASTEMLDWRPDRHIRKPDDDDRAEASELSEVLRGNAVER